MRFVETWQSQLHKTYADFARLAVVTPQMEAGPGLIGVAILWPIRQAIQEFDGEALDALRDICGPETKHIFKVVQSWGDDPLIAARNLTTEVKDNPALAEALHKLSQHFHAVGPFAEALAKVLVKKQGQGDVYNIAGQIKAALVNIGGTINIHSLTLTLNLSGITPEPPVAPFTVPSLPIHFVERPAEYGQLRSLLLADTPGRTTSLTIAIRGGSGFGKTTLAQALGHDPQVRVTFPDGILFITLGQRPANLLGLLLDQLRLFQPTAPDFTDLNLAAARLREELANRRVLLIFDDVWAEVDIHPFIQSNPGCAHLITTRRQDVASDLRAQTVDVNEMTTDQAATLLVNWLDAPPADRTSLLEFAHYLGEWPLLLELAAAQLRQRVELDQQPLINVIADLRLRLERKGFTYFDRTDEGQRNRAISLSLELSLDWLDKWRERYLELAVFPEDTDTPFSAVEKLWGRTANLDRLDAEDALRDMQRLSLFIRYDPAQKTIRLHDVIHAYLADQQKDYLPLLHNHLLDAHRPPSLAWADLPHDEPYLWNHLSYHLLKANGEKELHDLILDPNWLQTQRTHNPSLRVYTQDVDLILKHAMARGINGLPEIIAYGLLKGTLTTHSYDLTSEQARQMIEARQVNEILEWSERLPDSDWFKIDLMQGAAEVAIQDGQTERAVSILQMAATEVPRITLPTVFPHLRSIATDFLMLDNKEGLERLLSIAEELPGGIIDNFFNDKSRTITFLQQAYNHLEQGNTGLSLIQELGLELSPAIQKLTDPNYMRGGTADFLNAATQAVFAWANWAVILQKCGDLEQSQLAFNKALNSNNLIPPKPRDERFRTFVRLAEIAATLDRSRDEVKELLTAAIESIEQTPDALMPLYDKVFVANTSVKLGYDDLAIRLLTDILKGIELDKWSRRYEKGIIFTRLAPCAKFFTNQDEFLASGIDDETHRKIVTLSWQAHQGDPKAAEALLNEASNIEDKDAVHVELIRSSLEAIIPVLIRSSDDSLLSRWLTACLRILPADWWLHGLAEVLSEANFSDETWQQLAQFLMTIYNDVPDDKKVRMALQMALPFSHLPVLDESWLISLFHTTFVQEKPYHRSFALLAIANFGPLLMELVGQQVTLETWKKMQAVEQLFE